MSKFCELEYNLAGGAAIVATGPGHGLVTDPLRNYERDGNELIIRSKSIHTYYEEMMEYRLRVGSWVS